MAIPLHRDEEACKSLYLNRKSGDNVLVFAALARNTVI